MSSAASFHNEPQPTEPAREITAHAVGELLPVVKMSLYEPAWRGTCICGWQAKGWGSEQRARKDAQQHVDAKNEAS